MESGVELVDTNTLLISQRLLACLNNHRMTDVFLVGDDDVKVAASKYLLGSMSPQLQTLLYSEIKGSSVKVENCRAKPLQALVEFSCSDYLNTLIWLDTDPVEIVEDMVALAKLAHTYALPNLKQQVSDVLCPCLDQLPSLACIAFNLVDDITTPELLASSLEILRSKACEAFVKGTKKEIGGITCLTPTKLDLIMQDSEVEAEEIFLFQCLVDWQDANMDVYKYTSKITTRVAQHLDYSAMTASEIDQIVIPSGIVDSQSLLAGLMTVAKAAEKKGIALKSARHKTAREGLPADSSRRSGRRFKNVVSAAMNSTTPKETRELPESAAATPVYETTVQVKKLPMPSFRSPKVGNLFKRGVQQRASRLLGSMRGLRSVQEEPESIADISASELPLPTTPRGDQSSDVSSIVSGDHSYDSCEEKEKTVPSVHATQGVCSAE